MMPSLRSSPNAAFVLAFGAKSNIGNRLIDGNYKNKTVLILSRRAIISRSIRPLCGPIRKSIVKLQLPVQATHRHTTPWSSASIPLWGLNNSEAGKSWTRSRLPPHENFVTTSDPEDSRDSSKEFISRSLQQMASHVEGISNKSSDSDQCGFTDERGVSSAENNGSSHTLGTDSVLQEDLDFVDRRQSDGRSPNTGNGIQAESGNVGVREKGQGENALMGGNEDNDQDISLGRKTMGEIKRKKKKAYAAGIATYDLRTNSIRLKESDSETSAASHLVDVKQQRQRSPRSTKIQPIERGIQGRGAKSRGKDASLERATVNVHELLLDKRREKCFNFEEGARLSRLLDLENIDNIEQNPKLTAQESARREKFDHGGDVQPAVESNEGALSQPLTSNAPELALKSRPTMKFPGAKGSLKTKRLDQEAQFYKRDLKLTDVDVQAAASNEVVSCKEMTENPQKSENLEAKVLKPVLDVVSEPVVEQVGVIIDQVCALVSEQVQQVRSSTFLPTESVASTAGQVVDSISSTATQVSESVTRTATKFSSSVTEFLKYGVDAEDEFEESTTSNRPEFRGLRGLKNHKVLQEDQGILVKLRDFYFFMLKKPLPDFALGMMAVPLALSTIFTLLYLPEFQGLAYDDTVREFMKASTGIDDDAIGLELSWLTLFQVFMFSLSLSTGLQPDIAPLSPYTLVVANLNALCAQLTLAFLSAAVFARLLQPSEPVRSSSVALICSNNKRRGQKGQALKKVLSTRCVLAGPQPCELVNVKVDLTYRFNTFSSEGSYFRGSNSLKLVRSQIPLLDQGMLVRHIIDESSPLYSQTPQSLRLDDAIFVLSVSLLSKVDNAEILVVFVYPRRRLRSMLFQRSISGAFIILGGLERSSMQPVFHVQYYSVFDDQVIWNAEFEDMILVNQKNQRVVDHSKLSSWKSL